MDELCAKTHNNCKRSGVPNKIQVSERLKLYREEIIIMVDVTYF